VAGEEINEGDFKYFSQGHFFFTKVQECIHNRLNGKEAKIAENHSRNIIVQIIYKVEYQSKRKGG
jgi:hypothetical protein